jgi:hypothetical protein
MISCEELRDPSLIGKAFGVGGGSGGSGVLTTASCTYFRHALATDSTHGANQNDVSSK